MVIMSRVTNMMINVGYDDHENVTALSDWLRQHAREGGGNPKGCGSLREITGRDSQWGGGKAPECAVWAGALNYADHDAILDQIRQIPWEGRNELQVFFMEQHQAFFRVWMFRDGELRQVIPDKPDEGDEGFFPEWDD